ncbi:cupredoxin domain-containing protein [Natronobacterium texcoconense]|uniref:cupredoxin domain-containing protein n=1 Tax=Natronobacterium texcoconense TaxID=1095778 RepID=UPI000B816A07|nr:plastocyanin/azurin family copper-binding protein [Natronobacterium texcoconense]
MSPDRSSRRRLLAIAGGSLAITVAGCLGDESMDEDGNGAENEDADSDDVVEIETREGEDDEPDFVFDPTVAELEPGTTVRWVNTDGVFHTVTATDSLEERTPSEAFDETLDSEGETFEWTPDEAGIQHYYCEPHVGFMIGTLVVGDVDEADLEAVEEIHEDPAEVDGEDDDARDEVDEEFVDLTGEDRVEIETREGEDDEPDFVFDPAFVTIEAGTTVEWVNTDGVFHTVTSTDDLENRSGGGDVFDETLASEGDTVEWEADESGLQPYYCSPHAGFMYGALEIE